MSKAYRLSISTAALLIGLGTSPVLAQTATDTTSVTSSTAATTPDMTQTLNRNVNNDSLNSKAIDRMVDQDLSQQNKIEQGLKDGQLTTAEGAQLERGESRIDNMEANDLKNGALSRQEAAQLRATEYGMDSRITGLENNGNMVPAGSTANNKLIADVQRNINQEQRIDNGVDNGSLTASEAGTLESGQAKDDRADFHAGNNGTINVSEQQGVRGDENAQSINIRDDRHNNTVATGSVNESMNDRYRDHDRDRFASNNSDNDDNHLDRTHDFDRDHSGDDMNHHFTNVGNHKLTGHWSWDRKRNANVADQSQINGGTVGMNEASNASASNTAAVNGGSTSLNSGSSTTVATSGSARAAVTPVSTPPVVTPHIAPPPVTHVPMAHGK